MASNSGGGFERKDTTAPDEVQKLQAQIAALNAQVAEKDGIIAQQDSMNRLAADAQGGMPYSQNIMTEQPTGRKVTVQVAKQARVRKNGQVEFHDVEMPTYYFKIDLPPSGGLDIKVNGESFYHGQVYEFTMDQLRSIKDQVSRSWGHEKNIRGDNENIFRRPQNRVLSGKGMTR